MKKKIHPLLIVWLVLVISQVICAIVFSQIETYSLEQLKYAVAVFEGKSFVINAPYMSMLGFISKLTGVHPLVFVHTISALVMIPLAYFAYWYLLKTVFVENKTYCYAALCLLSVLNIFGYQSGTAMSFSLLTGYYSFGALVLHVILPLAAGFLVARNRQLVKEGSFENKEIICDVENIEVEDYQEEWDMKKHKIINARNLAIGLGAVIILLLAFVYVLNNKINTLYDATVNLQDEINSSCRTYEYAPNGEIEAYVIKNTDGSISVVRTGEIVNESEFNDFVNKYGSEVKSDYIIESTNN